MGIGVLLILVTTYLLYISILFFFFVLPRIGRFCFDHSIQIKANVHNKLIDRSTQTHTHITYINTNRLNELRWEVQNRAESKKKNKTGLSRFIFIDRLLLWLDHRIPYSRVVFYFIFFFVFVLFVFVQSVIRLKYVH